MTSDSSFEPSGVRYTRSYFEEYTWTTPQNRWNNVNSYGTDNTPFGSGVPATPDISNAQVTFTVNQPQIHVRSGALLTPPSSRPSLLSDTTPRDPPHLPAGGPPGSPMALRASLAGTSSATPAGLLSRDNSAWQGAPLERLVITPQTTTRVLARLRAGFSEAAGLGGAIHFTQGRGNTQVDVTFNPGLGAVTEMSTSIGGHLASTTTYRYEPVPSQGASVLTQVVTNVYGPSGSVARTFTQSYQDVTVR